MGEIRKLIDVKSLVTLAMTAVVIYLAVIGKTEIKDIYLIIIAFYFGTQTQKKAEKEEISNEPKITEGLD